MAVVARTTLYDLADRVIPGGIAPWLAERTAEGNSLVEIAYQLRCEHDITVSPELVRQWRQKEAA